MQAFHAFGAAESGIGRDQPSASTRRRRGDQRGSSVSARPSILTASGTRRRCQQRQRFPLAVPQQLLEPNRRRLQASVFAS